MGVALAKVSLLSLALLGVAQIAQQFETGFYFVKYGGAGYLCFLGARQLLRKQVVHMDVKTATNPGRGMDLLVGFGLGVSNPAAVIFYVALLPSIVEIDSVGLGLYITLAGLVALLWMIVAATYGGLAGLLRAALNTAVARRRAHRLSGATMLGAGALVATR